MITHVSIKNYKSLADVSVDLGPLTVLVGQNGTGKSNFVDALRFVSEAVQLGLAQAIKARHGINAILFSASQKRSNHMSMMLDFDFIDGHRSYSFEIAKTSKSDYFVHTESLHGPDIDLNLTHGLGDIQDATGKKVVNTPTYKSYKTLTLSFLNPDVTLEQNVSPTAIHLMREFLTNAGYYTILPETLSTLGDSQTTSVLAQDGSNIGSVLRLLKTESKDRFHSLIDFMSYAVPDIRDISFQEIGGYIVVKLTHRVNDHDAIFDIKQESDGTLRLLGILAALHQDPAPSLITIEEPELMIHPGVLGVLSDAIIEASLRSQIIVTTHSPDLISRFDPSVIRVVEKVDGATRISPMEDAQIETVKQKLFSTGELMLLQGLRGQSQS